MSAAVRAALRVATHYGIRCDEPVLLRDLTNVLVHLAPAPVVARVPVTLGRLRGARWESEVVELANFLAEAGAPIVAPARELPPGPYEQDGVLVSFWEHVDHDPARFDARAVGRSLAELHGALARYPGPLPRFDRLDEIAAVIDELQAPDAAILREAHARLSAARPAWRRERPLHGDVHFRNVLWTSNGPRWTDLENACTGPAEYDLAGLTWRAEDGTDEALAAYGPYSAEVVTRMTPYLATFLAAWTLDLAGRHPHVRPEAERRLARVREWLDGSE